MFTRRLAAETEQGPSNPFPLLPLLKQAQQNLLEMPRLFVK